MYSWNTIRTLCATLLLVPVLHLVYLVSGETLATLNPAPETWQNQVDAYAREDSARALPENPVVVIGGRRVGLWQGLQELVAPMPLLMRGLGDATVDDLNYYYERLVGFYRPHTVVLLPGNSEFHIRDNKSGEELAAAIRTLVDLDGDHGNSRRIYIFAPLRTPRYPEDDARISTATEQLRELARDVHRVVLLDANALLANGHRRPQPGYFRNDGVNLNEHGYLRLSLLLREQLERDNPQTYKLLSVQ